ncbi:unnamed protein product [Leuciscus chuanchicus]
MCVRQQHPLAEVKVITYLLWQTTSSPDARQHIFSSTEQPTVTVAWSLAVLAEGHIIFREGRVGRMERGGRKRGGGVERWRESGCQRRNEKQETAVHKCPGADAHRALRPGQSLVSVVLIPVKDTKGYSKNWQLEEHTGGTGRQVELLVLAGFEGASFPLTPDVLLELMCSSVAVESSCGFQITVVVIPAPSALHFRGRTCEP